MLFRSRESIARASGTVELIGAPWVGLVSGTASLKNGVSSIALSLMCAAGLYFALRGSSASKKRTRSQKPVITIDTLLKSCGLECLGTIPSVQILSGSPSSDSPARHNAHSNNEPLVSKSPERLRMIQPITDVLLWTWVGCFAFRFLTDEVWRELLFSVPLAAFSSLFGTFLFPG